MRPHLIQPVQVTLERLDQGATEWDDTFREPVADQAVKYKPAENVVAQVSYQRFDQRQMVPGGDSPETAAYILYDRVLTLSLKKGDKITAFGGVPLQNPVFVNSVEPAGNYGGRYYFEVALLASRAKGL